MQLYLSPELKKFFPETQQGFDQIMSLRGEVFRALEGRKTQRIEFAGQYYFIKQHHGVGWNEIIKNLFQLRLPIVSAKNEWRALKYLDQLKILTPEIVGYGCRGINPAKLQSFIITRELPPHESLEDFCKSWQKTPPPFLVKQKLIKEVARIVRTLHQNGINHRDCYICHFLLMRDFKIYLIDLHRAQIRNTTPQRWIQKDLAGLYFSSMNMGLTRRDLLRFIKEYKQQPLKEILTNRKMELAFWLKIKKQGNRLYLKHEK